jgi:hypothetical protein
MVILEARYCPGFTDDQIVKAAWNFDVINDHYRFYLDLCETRVKSREGWRTPKPLAEQLSSGERFVPQCGRVRQPSTALPECGCALRGRTTRKETADVSFLSSLSYGSSIRRRVLTGGFATRCTVPRGQVIVISSTRSEAPRPNVTGSSDCDR